MFQTSIFTAPRLDACQSAHRYEIDSNFIEFPDGRIGKALVCMDCNAWLTIHPSDAAYLMIVEQAHRNGMVAAY